MELTCARHPSTVEWRKLLSEYLKKRSRRASRVRHSTRRAFTAWWFVASRADTSRAMPAKQKQQTR